jgi:hypothetical protein
VDSGKQRRGMTDTALSVGSFEHAQPSGMKRLWDRLVRSYWDREKRNPELAKALAYVQRYSAEARSLRDLTDEDAPLRTAQARERVDALLSRDLDKISIDAAWELANELKRELLVLGDVPYVWTQLQYEAKRDEKKNKWHRWSEHFPVTKLRALIALRDDETRDRAVHLDAVRSLQKLYELRAEEGLDRRARAAQKCRYLKALIPFLVIALMLLSASVHEAGRPGVWKEIALAMSAGALGAVMSGIFRVRDRLVELDDLRSFWPAMRIQPLIGATAGLVTLFVLESGAVDVGGNAEAPWAELALFTFASGLSEPFFLGLVDRLAVPDKRS